MNQDIYKSISGAARAGQKQLSLLIDPDKYSDEQLTGTVQIAIAAGVDMFFIGGSLLVDNRVEQCINIVKAHTQAPVILFPGSPAQVNDHADALLLLSLISGRNADLLIGRHVEAAPFLKKSSLEIIPTGYMLIDSGKPTTASYISNTFPIPADKPDIAACTAIAGELLGLKLIYMDGGSGAAEPIPPAMIKMVKANIEAPLIIGGGIRTLAQLQAACDAGADIVVVGNVMERSPELLYEFGNAIKKPA